ncbi:hypothetical protein L226DRAFT_324427 [Lentinus tigrinus ALCF2SS1-7]|uniref:Uncharacterized protein n=1 Tax=Lentinus tigrinus ALCF2SS1-6 TaxID=1328759 RepID=A0A5C2SHK7_9APHY|nr:hypothetical protein L227DRAFT_434621 [Lentinus tigrinus ALCF2SS1-6]RPD77512.1 hypothetical protein L226DRAFT_324427 [Lentinus tigrinus ALCF2SS1-7]
MAYVRLTARPLRCFDRWPGARSRRPTFYRSVRSPDPPLHKVCPGRARRHQRRCSDCLAAHCRTCRKYCGVMPTRMQPFILRDDSSLPMIRRGLDSGLAVLRPCRSAGASFWSQCTDGGRRRCLRQVSAGTVPSGMLCDGLEQLYMSGAVDRIYRESVGSRVRQDLGVGETSRTPSHERRHPDGGGPRSPYSHTPAHLLVFRCHRCTRASSHDSLITAIHEMDV